MCVRGQNRCEDDCYKLCTCCKQCWTCDCSERCCQGYSSRKVELIRIVIFVLVGAGLAVAGFFMFYAATEVFAERKNWRIETMTCREVCGETYSEKEEDPAVCCYESFFRYCSMSRESCQNQQLGSMIFVMIFSGLFIAIAGWFITLALRSVFKLRELQKKRKQTSNLIGRSGTIPLHQQQL